MPENYSTLSNGLVTRALMKKLPGSLLLNSVMPQNLFPISTRHTWPNLALCQVFLKALTSGVFHFFFKDHTHNFYVQEKSLLLSTLLMWNPNLLLPSWPPSSPSNRRSSLGIH